MSTYTTLDKKAAANELFLAQRYLAEFYQQQKNGFDVNAASWKNFKTMVGTIDANMTVHTTEEPK